MWRYFPAILGFVLLSCPVVNAGQITKQAGNVFVRVADTAPATGVPRVEIQRRGEPAVTIELNNRTALVEDIKFAGPGFVIIHGKTYAQYPRTDTITVIDAASKKIVDTIWALDASFSPDGKTVAYFYRGPDTGCQGYLWIALVAYDLAAPAESAGWAGAGPGQDPSNFRDRGIVLYPEKHRLARSYSFFLTLEEGSTGKGQERHGFASPIAWSSDSKRLAVVEHEAEASRLVVIETSKGLLQPSVAKVSIPRESFIAPYYRNTTREEYLSAPVRFKNLHFTEDDRGIVLTSWLAGPFEEKSITFPIPEPPEPR
jgi:hypothetical protein